MAASHVKSGIRWMLTWLAMVAVAYPVSCVGVGAVIQAWAIHGMKRQVTGATPKAFPVLVMTPQPGSSTPKAQIVYQQDLEAFLAKCPQHSFLVPAGMEASIQSQLDQQSWVDKDQPGSGTTPWSATFRVERLPNGRQMLEVDAPPFDDTPDTGWYEATDQEIFPRYHKTYNDAGLAIGTGFLAGPIAIVPGLLLGTLATTLLRRRSRRAAAQAAASAAAPPPTQ